MRRKRRNKQRKLILITSLSLLFILTVGYAAFQTNLNITAKGNIIEKGITIEELRQTKCNQTSGDGLYKDITETNRCIYKGDDPDNYITFNDELWRIIGIEENGTLKIIKDEPLTTKMTWDTPGTRNSSTSTYCTNASNYGCNAWVATSNLVNTPSVFTLYFPNGGSDTATESYSGTVTVDSSLKTYLNNDYYNSIKEEYKEHIQNHNFNVGTPGYTSDNEDMATNVKQEALYKWNGKVGLMTLTEVLRTTTNNECTNLNISNNNYKKSICSGSNWMWIKVDNEWTISPLVVSARYGVWFIDSGGFTGYGGPYNAIGVRPVVHLKSSTVLSGNGTKENLYTIIK